MHILLIIIQAALALGLIILMAVQTDKAQQGGVMGIGGAGGRDTSEIDRLVGTERILKPLTKWVAGGFLMTSVLAAIPRENLTFVHVLVGIALYVVAMMYGALLWQVATGMTRSE